MFILGKTKFDMSYHDKHSITPQHMTLDSTCKKGCQLYFPQNSKIWQHACSNEHKNQTQGLNLCTRNASYSMGMPTKPHTSGAWQSLIEATSVTRVQCLHLNIHCIREHKAVDHAQILPFHSWHVSTPQRHLLTVFSCPFVREITGKPPPAVKPSKYAAIFATSTQAQ